MSEDTTPVHDIDREFWITVRAALIMFVRAIEKRYGLSRQAL